VGKKWRREPVLTWARAATALTLKRAVGFSPSIVAAAMRIFDRVPGSFDSAFISTLRVTPVYHSVLP
jgi:hypothetical protein